MKRPAEALAMARKRKQKNAWQSLADYLREHPKDDTPISLIGYGSCGSTRVDLLFAAVRSLTDEERKQFFGAICSWSSGWLGTGYWVFPDEQFDLLQDMAVQGHKLGVDSIGIAADIARKLRNRNRTSSPETIRRNVEICDLRKNNSKLWTQRKLAKKYEMEYQSIQDILDEEAKWRHLATLLADR
jgi:hypothetical protein